MNDAFCCKNAAGAGKSILEEIHEWKLAKC